MCMQLWPPNPWSISISCRRDSPLLFSIVTGMLVGTSYIPFPPWAIFFCLLPLWSVWIKSESASQVLFCGWVAQFVFTLIGFNWVSYTVYEFGHLPWWASGLTLILFASFANLHFPIAGWIWFRLCRRFNLQGPLKIASLALTMALAEFCFPMIFDWHFGYTWVWSGLPIFQLGDLFGFSGLSSLTYLANAALLMAWVNFKNKQHYLAWALSVPVVFLLLNVWGYSHSLKWKNSDKMLNAMIVQANIGNQEKLMSEVGSGFRDVVVNRFSQLTQAGLAQSPETDVILWPETAFPEPIEDRRLMLGYAYRLKKDLIQFDRPLITGAYSYHEKLNRITNSFFILSPKGEWLDNPYHKTVLLAFGEFLPGATWWPKLKELLPQVADFARGPGPSVLELATNSDQKVKIGAQICYEGLFSWFTRDLSRKGAQILVNLTNDSWYGTWEQPYQHAYMTFARAIEVRRPLIRSTNTGISGVMLASGELLELSPLATAWQHLYEIPYLENPEPTWYSGHGFYVVPALLLLSLLGILVYGITRTR